MADRITIRAALDLRPEDAIRAFRQRDALAVSVSYRDLEPEEHARAFTAAKVAKLDILAALGGSLDTALKEGQTFQQWRDGILPTLQREGWWGLIQDEALTGTSDPVFVGERRLRTIFATNMRVSRAAGQWARIQSLKAARPFLRYSAILDNRTRPLHARWHGIIRPVDDPIWQTIYPPNGWNCRCQVQQLSQRDLDRLGYRVTPDGDLPDLGPTGSAWFGGRAGNSRQEGLPRQRRDVIRGIDAGWDYNVGAQSLRGLAGKTRETLDRTAAADLDTAGRQVLEELLASRALEQFLVDQDAGFPIAIVSAELAEQLGSQVRVAILSRRTVDHIVGNGRVFAADLYRAASAGLADPLLQVRQRDGNIATVFEAAGRLYVVVLKAEPAKAELWAHTMFRTNAGDLARLRRTGEVLVDRL